MTIIILKGLLFTFYIIALVHLIKLLIHTKNLNAKTFIDTLVTLGYNENLTLLKGNKVCVLLKGNTALVLHFKRKVIEITGYCYDETTPAEAKYFYNTICMQLEKILKQTFDEKATMEEKYAVACASIINAILKYNPRYTRESFNFPKF